MTERQALQELVDVLEARVPALRNGHGDPHVMEILEQAKCVLENETGQ